MDGEVSKPGVVEIAGSMTILQSIAQAGGLREGANVREVMIIRRRADSSSTALHVDLKAVLNGKDPSNDLKVQPFDIVYIPRSKIRNVNKWVDQYLRQNIPITFGIYTPVF